MENTKYGFIYITTCNLNGKKYIGQRRYYKNWQYYLGSGTLLLRALKKHGRENFTREIIDYADSQEELNQLEIDCINKYNAVESDNYYNIVGGGGTTAGFTQSEESKQKMSIAKSGENSPSYGKFGEEHPAYGNIPHNLNTKLIICENMETGNKVEFTNATKFCEGNDFLKSKVSLCINGKRGSHKKHYFYYKDTGKTNLKTRNYNCKQFKATRILDSFEIIVNNANKFCVENNLTRGCVYLCLEGKRKTHKGWRFEYLN